MWKYFPPTIQLFTHFCLGVLKNILNEMVAITKDLKILNGSVQNTSLVAAEYVKLSVLERHRAVGVGPEEDHNNDQWDGTPLLWGKAERVGLSSLKKRRLQGDLTAAFLYFKGAYKKEGDKYVSRVCWDRTRGNGFKLRGGRFRSDIRKKFFMMRVVKHYNMLLREVVDAPSLETFKVRLEGARINLIYW